MTSVQMDLEFLGKLRGNLESGTPPKKQLSEVTVLVG